MKVSRVAMTLASALIMEWIVASPAVGAGGTITRAFPPFELGMPIEQFLSTVPAEEIGVLGEERLFSVPGRRVDVTGIWCVFSKGRLSRIEITHSVGYSSRLAWREFLAGAKREYGAGYHLPTQSGDVEMWDDGHTTLILERRFITARDRAYVVTLLDDAVAIERGGRCEPRKFAV